VYAIGLLNGGSGSPGVVVIDGTNNGTSAITLPSEDYGFVDPNEAGHSAIDPSRHRLYLGTNNFAGGPGTLVINTQTNAVAGTLTSGATQMTALPASGKLYVCRRGRDLQKQNSIGAVDPATGIVKPIVLAYEPFAFAVNRQTGRIYVADEQAAEVLVLNGSDHTILARIPIGSVNARHNIAVSESLNRVYVARSTYDQASSVSQVVDVIDGATNQVLGTVTLPISDQLAPSQVAVDDATHHTYVAASGNVCILNATANDNSVITTLSGILTGGGIAVNSATQRVYVSGGNGFGGNNVTIINTTTNQVVKTVSAGAIPGPIAINTQTKKVYVANTGAGSVDNSVTVINGVTDSVEDTVFNTNSNNNDAVSGVAVDESSNTLYVCDNSNQFAANGSINVFDANNNYAFLGQVSVGRYPVGAIVNPANAQLFVANDQSGTISVLGSFSLGPPPPPPVHGGLSATVFAVNESKAPTANVADTVLRFLAQQSGTPAGLSVRVQATTTPNDDSSWTDLANDRGGRMTFDAARNQFILNSTDYPLQNGVYFRAISVASAYPNSISNVVGPFNLVSAKPHLSPTRLSITANSSIADLYFRVTKSTVESGVALRIQTTTTPADESSWADLNNGNAGHMQQSTNPQYPNFFLLLVNNYPPGQGIFFRAVASLSGSMDSISNASGFNLTSDTPPAVTVQPPSGLAGSGDGHDIDHPILVESGTFHFGATAQSNRLIKSFKLKFDGSTVAELGGGVSSGGTDYTTNVIGDHIIEAVAVDDLGATARAGTGAIYLRVVPSPAAERRALGTASSTGKTFTAVQDGDWENPNTWLDEALNPGIPRADDFAIIGSHTINLAVGGETVRSLTLNGGHIIGPGLLDVNSLITIVHSGIFEDCALIIEQGATCILDNESDVVFSGTLFKGITNYGKVVFRGSGGVHGVQTMENNGTIDWQTPSGINSLAQLDPAAVIRQIQASSITNAGLITGNISAFVASDGASFISSDGASLIGHDGASLIGQDGAGIIGEHSSGLIGQDGAGFISDDGAAIASAARESTSAEGASASNGYVQNGGETDLSHVVILGSVALNGGSLTGSGIIVGDVTNNSYISPGYSTGGISILGNYTQGAQGTLVVENGGAAPGQYDRLDVLKTANLNGKLDVRDVNGYAPSTLDTFSPLGFSSATGSFSSVSSNTQVTMTANGLLTSVDPSVPAPKPGQPLNISTRMNVLAGDNVLIGGFIVTGPSGSTKKVLVRGIGPSLANFGVPGTLSDPFLELHKPDGTVVSNDNWQQGDTSQIPNGFAPSDPRESVIVATLAPGNYSAVLKGAHGETGVGLAEVYDLDSTAAAQLANISTRGFVNTGDNVMIGGFIVGGSEPTKVLVRAIGPSLAAFGVQGALPATTLELHDANGAVISNEGWRNTQETDITATTIPPSNDNEAAILATLVPGNYTAVVRGKNNTTGIGLVEAYNLQ
jgi:DNA-binding beta-propeller fold protein YncE